MSLTEVSEGVFDTPVNIDILLRGLRRGMKITKRPKSYNVRQLGQQGFFSRVGVLQCIWSEDEKVEVLIKLTTLLNTMNANQRTKNARSVIGDAAKRDKMAWLNKAEKLRQWHNNEVMFYECDVARDATVPRLFCSRAFDDENENVGFVVIELGKGVCLDIHQRLNDTQIDEVVTALADIQSSMHTLPEEKKAAFNVYPYEQLYADVLKPEVLSFRLDELRQIDASLSDEIDKVEKIAASITTCKMTRRYHAENGMTAVFVHGDLYNPNLLWKTDENGELQLEKIIDWQHCHFGSAAEDLCRLLVCAQNEERQSSWKRVCEVYHEQLHRRVDGELFTLDQIERSFCDFMPLVSLAFLACLLEMNRTLGTDSDKEATAQRHNDTVQKAKYLLRDILYFNGLH